jgi:hypothetical protein
MPQIEEIPAWRENEARCLYEIERLIAWLFVPLLQNPARALGENMDMRFNDFFYEYIWPNVVCPRVRLWLDARIWTIMGRNINYRPMREAMPLIAALYQELRMLVMADAFGARWRRTKARLQVLQRQAIRQRGGLARGRRPPMERAGWIRDVRRRRG